MPLITGDFEVPADDTTIWRYMDLSKLVAMLEHGGIFFIRADRLHSIDPFEGSYPQKNVDVRNAEWDEVAHDYPDLKDDAEHFKKSVPVGYRELGRIVLVNCWHVNNHESAAMWKLYLSGDEGIAIRSTVGKLKTCVSTFQDKMYISKMKYIDYIHDKMDNYPFIKAFIHKRKSFEHESELRLLMLGVSEFGKYVPVDLEVLIEEVFVSPTSPEWFRSIVQALLDKYGIIRTVKKSDLSCDPVY